MTDVQIYAGTLTASQNERTATGLLVPFGEECSSNLGRFKVDSGAFSVPADLAGIGLNVEHERENVVGAVTALTPTPTGVVATFSFANTPEGEQALADARAGRRRNLSAEVAGVVIQGGRAIAGRIFGAALVKAGAFPSATLLAAAADTEPATEPELDEFADRVRAIAREVVEEFHTETTESASVDEDTTEPDAEPDKEEEEPVGAATVPSTLVASATSKSEPTASDVFEMITAVKSGTNDGTLLAALTDIKTTGAGTLSVGGSAIQPAWLGEVWAEKAYTRKYMPLIRNGAIQAFEEKGYVIDQGAELVQAWSGNKTELPTGGGTTSPLSSVFQRWAWAADIAREYFDIPGGRPVIEAFLRKTVISYARATDKWTLQQLIAAAGTQVDAETYPDGYSDAIGKLIQAIDAVDQTDVDASFVIVAPDVLKDLRFTPRDQVPEYVNFGVVNGAESGTAAGINVVVDKFGLLAAGQVLAGGREVAHVNELGGASPIQLDALDIAKGGVDKATVGYTQFMAEYADGLVLVGDPVAP